MLPPAPFFPRPLSLFLNLVFPLNRDGPLSQEKDYFHQQEFVGTTRRTDCQPTFVYQKVEWSLSTAATTTTTTTRRCIGCSSGFVHGPGLDTRFANCQNHIGPYGREGSPQSLYPFGTRHAQPFGHDPSQRTTRTTIAGTHAVGFLATL